MDSLLQLAERCEAAEGPDRELDALIVVALGAWPNILEAEPSSTDEDSWSVVEREPDGHKVDRFSPEKFTASLDAAMMLVPEGWVVGSLEWWPMRRQSSVTLLETSVHTDGTSLGYDARVNADARAYGRTPALALCAAALRARHSQGVSDNG